MAKSSSICAGRHLQAELGKAARAACGACRHFSWIEDILARKSHAFVTILAHGEETPIEDLRIWEQRSTIS